jgi:hypothetical protein
MFSSSSACAGATKIVVGQLVRRQRNGSMEPGRIFLGGGNEAREARYWVSFPSIGRGNLFYAVVRTGRARDRRLDAVCKFRFMRDANFPFRSGFLRASDNEEITKCGVWAFFAWDCGVRLGGFETGRKLVVRRKGLWTPKYGVLN